MYLNIYFSVDSYYRITQEECLREESRYHYLNTLVAMANHKHERSELEKKYQRGDQRMMRDFGSLKDLFTVLRFDDCYLSCTISCIHLVYFPKQHKLNLQEQMIKQLRKQQKDLKESSGAMTNQKSIFRVSAHYDFLTVVHHYFNIYLFIIAL